MLREKPGGKQKTGKTGAAYAKRKAGWALEDSLGQFRACILREKPVRA